MLPHSKKQLVQSVYLNYLLRAGQLIGSIIIGEQLMGKNPSVHTEDAMYNTSYSSAKISMRNGKLKVDRRYVGMPHLDP